MAYIANDNDTAVSVSCTSHQHCFRPCWCFGLPGCTPQVLVSRLEVVSRARAVMRPNCSSTEATRGALPSPVSCHTVGPPASGVTHTPEAIQGLGFERGLGFEPDTKTNAQVHQGGTAACVEISMHASIMTSDVKVGGRIETLPCTSLSCCC